VKNKSNKKSPDFKGRHDAGSGAALSNETGPGAADRSLDPSRRRLFIALCILVFLLVFAVFYPITGNNFINYDDNDYVTENIHVQAGLTWHEAAWAFANTDAANWHPLTWLSHMFDCQLYGANPWGHHLSSVLIHAVNAALLFVVLRAMTGSVWRSLFAALLFGLHPLRVESVAWIAERKDVLSTMFWLLALWAFLGYAKTPRVGRAAVHYWLALLCFALGLMSKPMVVTLPFALLLIDYWPLHRLNKANIGRLVWEKTPFFLLAAAGSVVAFLAQKSQGAVIEFLPLSYRLETAVLAYARYLGTFFYPVNLAILYPHPMHWPLIGFLAAAVLFLAVSAWVIIARRSQPYFIMGWLWYVGTAAPVIGVVQLGSQSLADRYTYIPGIGLIIILTWGVCDLTRGLQCKRRVLGLAATAVIGACMALTHHQIGFWKDSGTLFNHAIAVTDNSYVARKTLGDYYWSQGRMDEAKALYLEALNISPAFEGAHLNLGAVLNQTGHREQAMEEFKRAIQLKPDDASAYNDLGAVLGDGHLDESIALFLKAIEISPGYADAHKNLGQAMDSKGRIEEAVAHYQQAVRLKPDSTGYFWLGLDLEKLGRDKEAVFQLTEALRLQPDNVPAQRELERLTKRGGR
jgi:Tfp pilus assembly protein PilF